MAFYALIMAGGKGTRFWPYSKGRKPKQYLSLLGSHSLLQQTIERLNGVVADGNRFVVTVKEQEELAVQQASKMINSDHGFIFEPAGRNTAPCILLALAHLTANKGHSVVDSEFQKSVVAILPSDHVILNESEFKKSLTLAVEMASKKEGLVTIGIRPNFPHTGYGYIKRGSVDKDQSNFFKVDSFKEKPSYDVACDYIKQGGYYWNAGMFVAPIGVFLNEFSKHAPSMYQKFPELVEAIKLKNPLKAKSIYENLEKESIDYAVLEKSSNIFVIEATFDWNDLGSWDALESVAKDSDKRQGNLIYKQRGEFIQQAKGNIVFAPNKFVSLINVEDLIIVDSPEALLILPKKDSQQVKKVVEYLENKPEFKDLL